MNLKVILCKFLNGITKENLFNILGNLDILKYYEFIESDNPQIVFFGPYGNQIPQKGNYIRVGLFPECILPPLDHCEFAFGAISEHIVKSEKYSRFEFWGYSPNQLIKKSSSNIREKTNFCSFFYSHKIPYREFFFEQLSKYKKINAPGKSMNNMLNVDAPGLTRYQAKTDFLSKHKFDISFENYSQPGYCTEKIYGALLAGTLPIYFGDPNIKNSFINQKSFINATDYIIPKNEVAIRFLEELCLEDFQDYRPTFNKNLLQKIKRKGKHIGREFKMKLLTNNFDFSPLISYIKEVDNNDMLYQTYMNEDWCDKNKVIEELNKQKLVWTKIFDLV